MPRYGATDMLSDAERRVLAVHCFGHAVASCEDCHREYRFHEVGRDVLGRRFHSCPSCKLDLTDQLRVHVLTCCAIADALEERVKRSEVLIKETDRLRTASAILAAESQALARRVLETKRETRHTPSATSVPRIAEVIVTRGPVCARCVGRHADASPEVVARTIAEIRLSVQIVETRSACPDCGQIGALLSFGPDMGRSDSREVAS